MNLNLVLLVTILLGCGEASTSSDSSPIAFGGTNYPFVIAKTFTPLAEGYYLLDTSRCSTWLVTNQTAPFSLTNQLPKPLSFRWSGPEEGSKVTYPNGVYYNQRGPGVAEAGDFCVARLRPEDLTCPRLLDGGIFLNLPNVTPSRPQNNPYFAGGFNIGLGGLVAGIPCDGIVEAIQKSPEGKHVTIFLTPFKSGLKPGWYDRPLWELDIKQRVGAPIALNLLPSETGATMTNLRNVFVSYNQIPENTLWKRVPGLEKSACALPNRLVLHLMEPFTMFPLCLFDYFRSQIFGIQGTVVTELGISRLTFGTKPEILGSITFDVGHGIGQPKLIEITMDNIIRQKGDSFVANFEGYDLAQLEFPQRQTILEYGGDNTVFLGNQFLLDFALEHHFAPPYSLTMQKFKPQ